MSNLVIEILLRLAKAGVAILLGAILYWVVTGPMAVAGSAELAAPQLPGRGGLRPARPGEPHLRSPPRGMARGAPHEGPRLTVRDRRPYHARSRLRTDGTGGGPSRAHLAPFDSAGLMPQHGSVAPVGPDSARTLHLNK